MYSIWPSCYLMTSASSCTFERLVSRSMYMTALTSQHGGTEFYELVVWSARSRSWRFVVRMAIHSGVEKSCKPLYFRSRSLDRTTEYRQCMHRMTRSRTTHSFSQCYVGIMGVQCDTFWRFRSCLNMVNMTSCIFHYVKGARGKSP